LFLPCNGHLERLQPLEGEPGELVGAESLGLLGEREEAIGLGYPIRCRLAQQLREEGTRTVEDRIRSQRVKGSSVYLWTEWYA
jgi:hypothetical protein